MEHAIPALLHKRRNEQLQPLDALKEYSGIRRGRGCLGGLVIGHGRYFISREGFSAGKLDPAKAGRQKPDGSLVFPLP